MPTSLDIHSPATWKTSTLNVLGGIKYWVLADWEGYYEQFADNANQTRVLIACNFNQRANFRKYALGFTEDIGSSSYFNRVAPLQCQFKKDQYLIELKKYKIHAGTQNTGVTDMDTAPDALLDYWPALSSTSGMPPRIVYDATFANLDYDVVDQTVFNDTGSKNEQRRCITYEDRMNAKERKTPSFGYETNDATATPIPEVGFLPYYDYEFTWTWRRVPYQSIPRKAIANCLLKVNNAVFGYERESDLAKRQTSGRLVGDVYGRYQVGDILFRGLASKLKPYRGPQGEWLIDLPYVFAFQPAGTDGTVVDNNGHQKIPKADGTWVTIRQRGSVASPKYLYQSALLDTLFRPES